jgi:hypothetical protein
VGNLKAFVPQKMQKKKLLKNQSKLKIKGQSVENTLRAAIDKGKISHKDLEGIIKRF